ncbi:MAG: regulatory protein RecX [Bacteroidota bacterium]|nr:regulatory protein RecX [Bacteroidota bacterium]
MREYLDKARRYCSYQERCHSEVRNKLYELGARGLDLDNIIVRLIEENFLNEERFAIAYAGGKFRQKQWGRVKITLELKARKISVYCIQKAMKEVPEDDYVQTLDNIIFKKNNLLKEKNPLTKKMKLVAYGISRGYEQDLVWSAVNRMVDAV